MNVLDYITDDFEYYLDVGTSMQTKPISVTNIDFSSGDTSWGILLSLDKSAVMDKKEALTLLILKLMFVEEEWVDPYTREDVVWYFQRLKASYDGSTFYPTISATDTDYIEWCLSALSVWCIRSIIHDNKELSREAFLKMSPLHTEPVVNLSTSVFTWLRFEFYIETETKYLLYHWFTNA